MWIFRTIIIVVILISWSSPLVWAMRFDLKSGSTKCITEDIKSSSMTVGKYTVITDTKPTPDSHKITIRVLIPFHLSFSAS